MSGLPSKEQNCLGVWSPVLSPVPPAGRTTDTGKSTDVSPEQVSPLPARPSRKTPGLAGLPGPSHLFRTLGCITSISLYGGVGVAHRTVQKQFTPRESTQPSHPPTRPAPAGPPWGPPKPESREAPGDRECKLQPPRSAGRAQHRSPSQESTPAKQPTTTLEFWEPPTQSPGMGQGPQRETRPTLQTTNHPFHSWSR
uniref:Uncharacterized protein n=1 Tax=Oryzias latipes TaxID=8090 RepID=A0A3P9M460_ORYLA